MPQGQVSGMGFLEQVHCTPLTPYIMLALLPDINARLTLISTLTALRLGIACTPSTSPSRGCQMSAGTLPSACLRHGLSGWPRLTLSTWAGEQWSVLVQGP